MKEKFTFKKLVENVKETCKKNIEKLKENFTKENIKRVLKETFTRQNISYLSKKYVFIIFGVLTLMLPDLALKSLLGRGFFWQGYVSIVSWMFPLFWSLLLVGIAAFLLPKNIGKIIFTISSIVCIIYSISEYIYYKMFKRFFWLKSLMLAGEGAAYADQILQQIDLPIIIFTVLEIVFLVLTLIRWRRPRTCGMAKFCIILVPILLISFIHAAMQPREFKSVWDLWSNPRAVYKNFTDVNKSMEIAGIHQFLYRDVVTTIFPKQPYDEKDYKRVDDFFKNKGERKENEYTGIFEGKNVIVVMMESMDTWMVNEKDTPTLDMMMKEGINLTNYNAPFFGAGYTFGSEFAFNTGFYTPSSAISAANFSTNIFPYSLARLFTEAGYSANSFHFNDSEYYNRGIMHECFGYEKYNSFTEFGLKGIEGELDSNILKNDAIFEKMTPADKPFFDFLITYSPHLPYEDDNERVIITKEYYPELVDETIEGNRNNISVLARDTDEFFRLLLEKLETKGILEDTVIIAYTDHYAYGVYDDETVMEWKGNEGLIYRVPAFIYSKGMEHMEISKPTMTIDWAPTIVNLFGLETDARYLGNDMFDPENGGLVLFESRAWLDDVMYYEPSAEQEVSEEEKLHIEEKSKLVNDIIEINDIIVLGDYYKNRKK